MAIYQQSSLTFANAKSMVAAAAGGEGDTLTETPAARAVSAALERWNNYWPWQYYIVAHTGFYNASGAVHPATSMTVCAAASGSTVLQGYPINTGGYLHIEGAAVVPGHGWTISVPDAYVYDAPFLTVGDSSGLIALGFSSMVDIPDGSTVTFKQQGFKLPTDMREIYEVRLIQSDRTLTPIEPRDYHRYRYQNEPGTPERYAVVGVRNMFATTAGSTTAMSAALQLFPPSNIRDQVYVSYHRRPVMPSSDSVILDIPQDAELGVIALGKAYFLADRGGDDSRLSLWRQEGEAALRELRGREIQGDKDPGFKPGYLSNQATWHPNDTRMWVDD